MDEAGRWREEIRAAEGLSARGRWEEAGAAWSALARTTAQLGALEVAGHAARAGADAWRRADRPARAVALLAQVVSGTRATSADAALLAGCLLETGGLAPARDAAGEAVRRAREEAEAVLARDTRLGVRLACGEIAAAAEDLSWLEASGLPGAELAAKFRGAQLARLRGDFSGAQAAWRRLTKLLGSAPAAAGALAGLLQEQGETELLRARLHTLLGEESQARAQARAATTSFEGAGRASTAAQRRAGLLRAEAWGALARARSGRAAILPRAGDMVAWAASMGLPLLEAELRGACAELRGDSTEDAAALALLPDAPLARGRARVRAWLAGRLPHDAEARARAAGELSGDAPWSALLDALDPELREDARQRARGYLGG